MFGIDKVMFEYVVDGVYEVVMIIFWVSVMDFVCEIIFVIG